MCVAYSQTKPSDPSVSKTLKPIAPLYPVAYDTAPLRKERVLSHSDSNQVSSISSQKMKLAPVGATNTKSRGGQASTAADHLLCTGKKDLRNKTRSASLLINKVNDLLLLFN